MTSGAPPNPVCDFESAAGRPSTFNFTTVDALLAAALGGRAAPWPPSWQSPQIFAEALHRIHYHGIAGLLTERETTVSNWPVAIGNGLRATAIAQAMWELRHRSELSNLLDALAEHAVDGVILKGTAIAYDLYRNPSARARGDSDLLVARSDVERARAILALLGYARSAGDRSGPDPVGLQEAWRRLCDDGSRHEIDLHWAVVNAPALRDVLTVDECIANRQRLRHLGDNAFGMDRVRLLIHTCMHRAMHITAPYFVEGRTYYGGDRLIWLNDIHLIARSLANPEWEQLVALARHKGVAAVCLYGLDGAACRLGTVVPAAVRANLADADGRELPSAYLLDARQLGRSRLDFQAMDGVNHKWRYFWSRAFPPATSVRAKYPGMAPAPLALLYARRFLDLVRKRKSANGK